MYWSWTVTMKKQTQGWFYTLFMLMPTSLTNLFSPDTDVAVLLLHYTSFLQGSLVQFATGIQSIQSIANFKNVGSPRRMCHQSIDWDSYHIRLWWLSAFHGKGKRVCFTTGLEEPFNTELAKLGSEGFLLEPTATSTLEKVCRPMLHLQLQNRWHKWRKISNLLQLCVGGEVVATYERLSITASEACQIPN